MVLPSLLVFGLLLNPPWQEARGDMETSDLCSVIRKNQLQPPVLEEAGTAPAAPHSPGQEQDRFGWQQSSICVFKQPWRQDAGLVLRRQQWSEIMRIASAELRLQQLLLGARWPWWVMQLPGGGLAA